jgi:Tol biopolymer transport system component/predicted Ser/Thr protein kinase
MPVEVGATLGPYEILELLGTGGMGEVFKARDTRLDRLVAIKVSREEFSERFQREARLVASLNHPHICTLYDIGPNYLVMEYVEGKPVKGPLPLKEALRYGAQIASALDHAHRKEVVHRDLKPDNILVTKTGVKLLDFGLAKRFGPDDPTITAAGSVMGTPAYMAPEQWKGRDADPRTDIFAFGCLLYEVVTGRSARLGIQQVRPIELEWVIKHCLEEDPADRWQSAVDLRAELEHLRDQRTWPIMSRVSRRLPWIAAAAGGLLALVFASLWLTTAPERAPQNVMRFFITPPEGTVFTNTLVVSPDGRRVAFTADGADGKRLLWVRSLETLDAQALSGTDGAFFPFWAPDSRRIGFFAGRRLKKTDTSGSPPEVLANAPNGVGGAWSPDGTTILFAPNSTGGLFQIAATGGEAVPVTTVVSSSDEIAHRRPHFLPDGKRFLFFVSREQPEDLGIYLGSLSSKEKTLVLPQVQDACYAPPGFLLFVRDRTLMAHRFNAASGKVEGEARAVASAISSFRSFSASETGVLVYRSGNVGARGQLTWFDRGGKQISSVGPTIFSRYPSLSPDGSRVAVERLDSQVDGTDIWVAEPARGINSRFTSHPASETAPVWSPDGARIVFSSSRRGPGDLYVKPASGGGSEQALLKSPDYKVPTDWSGDGRFLAYQVPGRAGGIWILPMIGGGKPFPFRTTNFTEVSAQFSPDAGGPRWIAYSSDESGQYEVYVQEFPGSPGAPESSGRWQVSEGGGRQPRWRRDGRELYYIANDRSLMAVEVRSGDRFAAGRPKPLFPTRIVTEPFAAFHYAVTADGQRFLIDTVVDEVASKPLTVVMNWTEAFKD